MRYISLSLVFALSFSLAAQEFTSTTPRAKKLVIEEFSGIYCGFCPDGALKVEAILDKYPDQAVTVSIHSSNTYSQPQNGSGHPDFRTVYGGGLQSLSGLAGFPAGMINRRVFSGMSQQGSSLAMSRNFWMSAADQLIAENEQSPVNIGLRSTWNDATRELTIEAEVYYTATESSQDRLHIHLKENSIVGYQSNGGSNYTHNHVLRDVPTGFTGELISVTTEGTLFTKTYTVDVPANWNIDNCRLVGFVTKVTKDNTHTGVQIPARNGATAIEDITPADISISVYPNPTQGNSKLQLSVAESAEVKVEVLNLIGEIVSEPFNEYTVAGKTHIVDLGTADLKAGIYFVHVQVGNTAKTVKLHVLD